MNILTIGLIWLGMAVISLGSKIHFRNYTLFRIRETGSENDL
jgi:hypothetical protein